MLPRLRPKEFFRPAQVDANGNFNNIAFGKNYRAPRLRLPGSGGIPDVTTFLDNIHLYVPRHSRVTFVERLDYLSGLGHHPARAHGAGPRVLISDLGVFDFVEEKMRLLSHHPGVEVKRIQAKTGFDLNLSEHIQETIAPTPEELELIREEIDPLGIRKLELLSGAERRVHLREIIAQEV